MVLEGFIQSGSSTTQPIPTHLTCLAVADFPNVLHNIEVVPSFCKYRQLQRVDKRLAHNLLERLNAMKKACDYIVSLTTLWYRNVHYTSILRDDCDREQAHL